MINKEIYIEDLIEGYEGDNTDISKVDILTIKNKAIKKYPDELDMSDEVQEGIIVINRKPLINIIGIERLKGVEIDIVGYSEYDIKFTRCNNLETIKNKNKRGVNIITEKCPIKMIYNTEIVIDMEEEGTHIEYDYIEHKVIINEKVYNEEYTKENEERIKYITKALNIDEDEEKE